MNQPKDQPKAQDSKPQINIEALEASKKEKNKALGTNQIINKDHDRNTSK